MISSLPITGNQYTAWNVSKHGIFSGPYFPVFGLNTRKYEPVKTSNLDTFHAVINKRATGSTFFVAYYKQPH